LLDKFLLLKNLKLYITFSIFKCVNATVAGAYGATSSRYAALACLATSSVARSGAESHNNSNLSTTTASHAARRQALAESTVWDWDWCAVRLSGLLSIRKRRR
jgi:hypothetical protein